MKRILYTAISIGALMAASPSYADKLDDIISSGTLRCAASLDLPPMGFRDSNNEPSGFDVDYCKDLAKALGVTAEIVEVTLPERVPAIITGRADVAVANTSDTLERAKTVGFSIPYVAFKHVVLTYQDSGVNSFEDLKGHAVGGVAGAYSALELESHVKEWNNPEGTFRAYQSMADAILAVSQKQVDGIPLVNTTAGDIIKSGKYPDLVIAGETPFKIDYTAIIMDRKEHGLRDYIDLFINQQVRTGRYNELWQKWVGSEAPQLTISGVYR